MDVSFSVRRIVTTENCIRIELSGAAQIEVESRA